MKFSDIVPDTTTIFNHNKKKLKDQIISNTVPLKVDIMQHTSMLYVQASIDKYINVRP